MIDLLTVAEMISNSGHDSPGVSRLGLPSYNWWSEALVGKADNCLLFLLTYPSLSTESLEVLEYLLHHLEIFRLLLRFLSLFSWAQPSTMT